MRASAAGAIIQISISSDVRRVTGIAFGWNAPPSAVGSVVRNPSRSFVVSPSLTFLTEVHGVEIPAKTARGLVSSNANHASGLSPSS